MLGFRGCRLGIVFPRSPRCRPAPSLKPPSKVNGKASRQTEIMILLVGFPKELQLQLEIVNRISRKFRTK